MERWRSDCGCRVDGQSNPSQAWRTPLRAGLEVLAAGLHAIFEEEGATLLSDPWAARDAWGGVVSSQDLMDRARFLSAWLLPAVSAEGRSRALELLEMERDAMRMFTSCAWFFDDIGGLEVRQVLQYAMRGLALSEARDALEPVFRRTLGGAHSNHATVGTGADVYDSLQHEATPEERVAAAARTLHDLRLPVEDHLPPGMDATVDGDAVHVIVRTSGRTRAFEVVLARRTSSDLAYKVTSVDGDATMGRTIPLWEYPERSRFAIRAALRRALLPRCLTLAELEQLASGEASLRGLVAVALTRAIDRLAADRGDDAMGVVHAALDLFEQLETNIPFDAQTAWWRVLELLPPADHPSLSTLSTRLGFAAG
ncbi:MAG: DUF3536 domain-containing protein [Cytophagaceae bacterium]|nr:DUF3536 domain-containing protein [Gemmatimonadaceae bacterium]